MKYDKPLLAAVIGALSTVPGELLSRLFLLLGIGKYSVYQLDSLIVTFNRPNIIIGLIVNIIVGGLSATLFYYAVQKLGRDYLALKALGFSTVFWLAAELIFTGMVEGKYFDIRPINDYYVHLIGAVAFGLTLGLLFKKYLFTNVQPALRQ